MRLAEQNKLVYCVQPQDHNAAGIDGDSVSLENYSHVAFIITFGELTGDAVLTVNSGATAGTKTTAETFNYRATAIDMKSAGGDALGAEATSAALTVAAATYEDRMIVVEMDADEFTDGQQWITVNLSDAASELFVSVVAVLSKPRYGQNVPPTAIA